MTRRDAANPPYRLPPPLFDARCTACWVSVGAVVLVVASFWTLDLQWAQFLSLEAARSMARFIGEFIPPDTQPAFLRKVVTATWETFAMSALGTALAALAGVLLALPASRMHAADRAHGRTPTRLGIHDWIPAGSPVHLRKEEVTIPKLLKQAGYATCHVGKWHCNGKFNSPEQPQPGDHGFDHWFSTQNNAGPSHHNPRNFVRNGRAVGPMEGYSSALIVSEASRWSFSNTTMCVSADCAIATRCFQPWASIALAASAARPCTVPGACTSTTIAPGISIELATL